MLYKSEIKMSFSKNKMGFSRIKFPDLSGVGSRVLIGQRQPVAVRKSIDFPTFRETRCPTATSDYALFKPIIHFEFPSIKLIFRLLIPSLNRE